MRNSCNGTIQDSQNLCFQLNKQQTFTPGNLKKRIDVVQHNPVEYGLYIYLVEVDM